MKRFSCWCCHPWWINSEDLAVYGKQPIKDRDWMVDLLINVYLHLWGNSPLSSCTALSILVVCFVFINSIAPAQIEPAVHIITTGVTNNKAFLDPAFSPIKWIYRMLLLVLNFKKCIKKRLNIYLIFTLLLALCWSSPALEVGNIWLFDCYVFHWFTP